MENLLLKKLQIKSGFQVALINEPANFNEIIGELPNDVTLLTDNVSQFDAVLIFAITKAALNSYLQQVANKLTDKKICWIIYPKAKTTLASDLNLMQSWNDLKNYSLTPCASAAINALWTAIRIKPVGAQKKSGVGNKEIQQNGFGDYIDVANKVVKLPKDFREALSLHAIANNFYEQLSYSNRKEYVLWILTAKQEKTRTDRINKTVEKLLMGKKNPSEK